MIEYKGLFIVLTLIFTVVLFNKFMFWWAKTIILIYYSVVSCFFITVKNKIDNEYKDVLPVPDAYWDRNSGWVDTVTGLLFWPLIGILIFIYIKWFMDVQTKLAKTLILLSIIPAALLLVVFSFFFALVYGYRP